MVCAILVLKYGLLDLVVKIISTIFILLILSLLLLVAVGGQVIS